MSHLHERVILDPSAPSAVRILGKSLYLLAAGWTLAIAWLWVEAIRQHQLRYDAPPPDYAAGTLGTGFIAAVLLATGGWAVARFAGRASHAALDRREWRHAFWWSLLPNLLLFATVWVMVRAGG